MPPTFFLVLSAALLSLGSVVAKGLLDGGLGLGLQPIAPLPFLTCQLAGSLILLALLAARRRGGFALGSAARVLNMTGLVSGVAALGTILALSFMPVGEASVIFATQPIVILILARLLLGEQIRLRVALLSLLAVLGVVVILTGAVEGTATDRRLGAAFALLATVAAAAYVVWMRQVSGATHPLAALFRVQAIGCLAAALAWAVGIAFAWPQAALPSPFSALAAGGTGALYYGVAFYVYLIGLARMEAGRAGVFLTLVPVFSIALAALLLGERFAAIQWMGAAVVLAALFALSRRARPKACPANP
ncbi:MAG: DMT family transporter [Pseudomonadota bacterium]